MCGRGVFLKKKIQIFCYIFFHGQRRALQLVSNKTGISRRYFSLSYSHLMFMKNNMITSRLKITIIRKMELSTQLPISAFYIHLTTVITKQLLNGKTTFRLNLWLHILQWKLDTTKVYLKDSIYLISSFIRCSVVGDNTNIMKTTFI